MPAAPARDDERGFALVELLVAMTILTFVLGAVLSLLDVATRQAPRDRERAVALREAQAGVYRMTRELRQAYRVLDAQPKSIYVIVAASPTDLHVRYDCDVAYPANTAYRRCVRWQAPVGQELRTDLPGTVVVDRLLSQVVFTYTPGPLNPTYVRTRVEVPQAGEQAGGFRSNLVLDDGFYLRNTDVLR